MSTVTLTPAETRTLLEPAERLIEQRILALFAALGAQPTTCSCGATIYFLTTRSGKQAPLTVGGLSHFADCPHAAQHRKAKRSGRQ